MRESIFDAWGDFFEELVWRGQGLERVSQGLFCCSYAKAAVGHNMCVCGPFRGLYQLFEYTHRLVDGYRKLSCHNDHFQGFFFFLANSSCLCAEYPFSFVGSKPFGLTGLSYTQ